jgi:hypothetical protein
VDGTLQAGNEQAVHSLMRLRAVGRAFGNKQNSEITRFCCAAAAGLARFEYTHARAPQVGLLEGSAQSVFETGQHFGSTAAINAKQKACHCKQNCQKRNRVNRDV